jgi:hypothetical protein
MQLLGCKAFMKKQIWAILIILSFIAQWTHQTACLLSCLLRCPLLSLILLLSNVCAGAITLGCVTIGEQSHVVLLDDNDLP